MTRDVELSRRELLRRGGAGLTWGLFGLSLPTIGFAQRALGAGPSSTSLYDAVIQVFFEGAPSQSDTLDPKLSVPLTPARNGALGCARCGTSTGHTHFDKISLGVRDQDDPNGGDVEVTDVLSRVAALARDPRSGCGLGLVRSVYHFNGEHGNAQKWVHCFADEPTGAGLRPSAAACVAHYRRAQAVAAGVPGAAVIQGAHGNGVNDAKGAQVPTGLAFDGWRHGNELAFTSSAPTARRDRRALITGAVNERLLGSRPDPGLRAWVDAWRDAEALTRAGKLGPLLRYVEDAELLAPVGADVREMMRRLTMAWRLAEGGVPFVAVGLEGNDTHGINAFDGNDGNVGRNWRLVDLAISEMARRAATTGKRVLIVLGGEFGRTPFTVTAGRVQVGRDHWAGAFSWGLVSLGQPRFRTGSVGYTGPNGDWTPRTPDRLVSPVLPGAVGSLVYRCLGVPVGEPSTDVVMRDGPGCPLPPQLARVAGPALMARFGLPPI